MMRLWIDERVHCGAADQGWRRDARKKVGVPDPLGQAKRGIDPTIGRPLDLERRARLEPGLMNAAAFGIARGSAQRRRMTRGAVPLPRTRHEQAAKSR